jgi:acylphosphatase
MTDPTVRAVHVRITGRVQGVGYRAWTVDEARRRGLSGWVRNLADGDVEAVFSGPKAPVDDMIAACRRGPPSARVDQVMVEAAEPVSGPFKVLYER